MPTLRGTPNPPAEPEYLPEPTGMFKGAARKEVEEHNAKLAKAHKRVAAIESTVEGFLSQTMKDTVVKTTKGCVVELVAAARARENFKYHNTDTGHRTYSDPMEYISDLWTDGYIDDDKAEALLTKLQKDGEVIPTTDEKRFEANRNARIDINSTATWELPKKPKRIPGTNLKIEPNGLPPGSAKKLEKEYERQGVLIPEGEEPILHDDSPMGFLLQEKIHGHITEDEYNIMMAWERKPERTRSTEELTALRKHVVEQLTGADTGLSKGQAAIEAIEALKLLSGNDLDKALKSAEAEKPAAIGAAIQRELERRSAPATEQGRG